MHLPEAFEHLDDAQQLLKVEVRRAISLFPKDECEAICEILRRSHSMPDLKRVLLVNAAFTAVAEARGTGHWMWRRNV